MKIKLANNGNVFNKNNLALYSNLKNIENKETDRYNYTVFIPLNMENINNVHYISIYASNKSLANIKSIPKLGKSIDEKNLSLSAKQTPVKINSTIFKITQNIKSSKSIGNHVKHLGNFDIDKSLFVKNNKDNLIYHPFDLTITESMLKEISYNKNNKLSLIFFAMKKNHLKIDKINFFLDHEDKKLAHETKLCFDNIKFLNKGLDFSIQKKINLKNNIQTKFFIKYYGDNLTKEENIDINTDDILSIKGKEKFQNYQKIEKIKASLVINNMLVQNIVSESINQKSILNSSYDILYFAHATKNDIIVNFSKIPEHIDYIELFKRERFEYLKNNNFISLGKFQLADTNNHEKIFSYIDKNIKDMFFYDYYIAIYSDSNIPVYLKNHIASAQYKIPKNIVDINLLNLEQNKINLSVNIKINKIEDIFSKLGRNDFDLYKEELQNIKGLNGTIVSILLEKYNKSTGMTTTLGEYTFDKNNQLSIDLKNRNQINELDIIYCYPKITNISQLISKEIKKIDNYLGQKSNQELFSSLIQKSKSKKDNIQSYIGNKYTNDFSLKHNLLIENNNLYDMEEQTGDNLYFSLTKKEISIEDIEPITHKVKKIINYQTKNSFMRPENILKEYIYFIKLIGTLPNDSESIIFYYVNSFGEKNILSKGTCINTSKINFYMINFKSESDRNNITYEIIDNDGTVLLSQQIE